MIKWKRGTLKVEEKKNDWLKNPKLWIGVGVAVVAIIAVICLLIGFGGCNDSKETAGNGETQVQTQEETESATESESVAETESQLETESQTESQTETESETESVTEAPTQKETQKVTEAPTQKETETQIQLTEEEKKAKAVVDTIITPSMSDVEKVIAIHNWICVNFIENITNGANTASEAFESKVGSATGYAKTFEVMAKVAGQGCECVAGTFIDLDGTRRAHMWNKVEIDGQWYNIDVANDDGYKDVGFFFLYLLKSDEQFAQTYEASTTGTHACPKAYDALKATKLAVARGDIPNCVVATTPEEMLASVDSYMAKGDDNVYVMYVSESVTKENQWEPWKTISSKLTEPAKRCYVFEARWGGMVYEVIQNPKSELDSMYVAHTKAEAEAYAKQMYESGVSSYKVKFEPTDGNVSIFVNYGGGCRYSATYVLYKSGKIVTVNFVRS